MKRIFHFLFDWAVKQKEEEKYAVFQQFSLIWISIALAGSALIVIWSSLALAGAIRASEPLSDPGFCIIVLSISVIAFLYFLIIIIPYFLRNHSS